MYRQSNSFWRRTGVPEAADPGRSARGSRGGDDGDSGRGKRGAHGRPVWLSLRLLSTLADHAVGKIELRVPQDRQGRFSTELFERYQRSEKALVAALAEMYVQGGSTWKVKQVTEELVGHAFSASAISAINKRLDVSPKAFCERKLKEPYPYLILDARYERVREDGIIARQAALIARREAPLRRATVVRLS
jgi:Transposase, Mutator family